MSGMVKLLSDISDQHNATMVLSLSVLKETVPFGLCKAVLHQAGGDSLSCLWQLDLITCEFST